MTPALGPARRMLADERIRFVAVGGFNTVFGLAAFVVFEQTLGTVAHYLIVLLVAHVVSTFVAFLGHRYLVFRVRGSFLLDLVRFWSVYVVVLALNVAALPLLVEVLGLPVIPAQTLFTIATVLGSYLGHKHFSFRRA